MKKNSSFDHVGSAYGAPMGRLQYGSIADLGPKSCVLARVLVDAGGYDPGGAYWGLGSPLWIAEDTEGNYRRFVRACNRSEAAALLGLSAQHLKRAVKPVSPHFGIPLDSPQALAPCWSRS